MLKITIIAGARPNFMKIAPIIEAIKNAKNKGKQIDYRLVHTGQHYDKKLSDTFLKNSIFRIQTLTLRLKVEHRQSKQLRL